MVGRWGDARGGGQVLGWYKRGGGKGDKVIGSSTNPGHILTRLSITLCVTQILQERQGYLNAWAMYYRVNHIACPICICKIKQLISQELWDTL